MPMSKHYEAAFKLEVARMVVDQGLSIVQVVKDLNIGRTTVTRWIEQYRAEQLGKTGIGKPITAEQQRIRHPYQNRLAVFGGRNGDLYSRKIIGWAMSPTMPSALVWQALQIGSGSQRLG
jgi:DNA-binding transcriptional regulator LsrR (DeoR family)